MPTATRPGTLHAIFRDTLKILRFLAFGDKGFIFVQTGQYYGDKNRFILRRQQNDAQKTS